MTRKNDYNEIEILLRLSENDESAFKEVYDRFWKRIYAVAQKYLRSSDLADDVVQEIFSTLWIKRKTFVAVRNLESYLITMTKNCIYKELRKWTSEIENNEVYYSHCAKSVDDSEHLIVSEQYREILEEAINLLPPQQKKVFLLSRDEGFSHQDIAEELNVSKGTVKNHMVRALQFIRQYLIPYVTSFLLFFPL